MFVQVNPDGDSYAETVSTLKFAERVSGVELGAAKSNKEGRDVRHLMEQVLISFFFLSLSLNIYFWPLNIKDNKGICILISVDITGIELEGCNCQER